LTAPAIAIGLPLALLTVGGVTIGLARRMLMITVVDGASMAPTYADGQRLLVRRSQRFRRDDVVVFREAEWKINSDSPALVKRVIAMPGDTVPVDMKMAVTDKFVPAGMFLVQGDNPDSLDSRRHGYARVSSVRGVVLRPLASAGKPARRRAPRGGQAPPPPSKSPEYPNERLASHPGSQEESEVMSVKK
jgi:signal peptidase I